MLISVCIIAKDASHCIEKALQSAEELGEEIIVRVDSSTTDNTFALVHRYIEESKSGTRIKLSHYDFSGFGAARDEMINMASGAWIFMLDADEIMDPEDCKKIRARINQGLPSRIYTFPRKNWLDLDRMQFAGEHYPDVQARLWKSGMGVEYGDQLIHEGARGLPLEAFPDRDIHIHHFCFAYRSHRDWHHVNEFYADLVRKQEEE